MITTEKKEQDILDFSSWELKLPELKKEYNTEVPFPHIVLENFLKPESARAAMNSFPSVKDEGWIHYVHFNEKKHGLNKMNMLPAYIQEVLGVLNSDRFVKWLEQLTGINGLHADEMLEGGGLHQSLKGGFLNIHADFTVHPHKRNWQRRVNVLVYLNEDWKDEYGGFLELWSRDMKKKERSVSPIFNRCVIFNTDKDSFHGLPDAIKCPEDMTRKSIALYYFTEEKNIPVKKSTDYQARPEDGLKSALIYADKKAVAIYSRLKGWLGINDDFVSNLLNRFGGKK